MLTEILDAFGHVPLNPQMCNKGLNTGVNLDIQGCLIIPLVRQDMRLLGGILVQMGGWEAERCLIQIVCVRGSGGDFGPSS